MKCSGTKKSCPLKKSINSKKDKLFRILKAYAHYDPEVSYVQGSNYIVNLLLCNINSQRGTFWTYVQIMNDKNWRDMFIDSLPKLMRMLSVLKEQIKIKNPLIILDYFATNLK